MKNSAFLKFLTDRLLPVLWLGLILTATSCKDQEKPKLQIAVFDVDVTPPLGTPVAYAPAMRIDDPLSAKGIVFLSDQPPIVFCSVDYLGIANEGMQAWKESLATAANTTIDRVSVHAIHQHDGMRCDFTTENILAEYGLGGRRYDNDYNQKMIDKAGQQVRLAMQNPQVVTHLGTGKAKVKQVASNRRVLGPDGQVAIIRWSRTTDSAAIAAPEGLVDPWLRSVSFWNDDQALAVMTYYAVHPQSYYGEGHVTCDFVGIARNHRQQKTNLPHIHFNGAGGNITAGKYNDGSEENRPVLTQRMEKAMAEALKNTAKSPVSAADIHWRSVDTALPLGSHLVESDLREVLADEEAEFNARFTAAKHLAWLKRTEEGHQIQVSSLQIGDVSLLNLPGELFIEYQLAAQEMRPQDFVCTAAYEEYGPGYIGTEIAYTQGGYETSERASRVAPKAEGVLMAAIRKVLAVEE